ncbi:MAG: hypothetical protein WDM81_21900 [Rhizomicrobium sp.]
MNCASPFGVSCFIASAAPHGRDDLAVEAAIAVAVIAIVMGVDQRADFRRRRPGEAVQHRARMRGIEHRVDQQRLAAIRHQPGIGEAPAAVGLQIGEGTGPEIDHAGLIRCLAEGKRHPVTCGVAV